MVWLYSGGRDRPACWPPAASHLTAGWLFVQQIQRTLFTLVTQPADRHCTTWAVWQQHSQVKYWLDWIQDSNIPPNFYWRCVCFLSQIITAPPSHGAGSTLRASEWPQCLQTATLSCGTCWPKKTLCPSTGNKHKRHFHQTFSDFPVFFFLVHVFTHFIRWYLYCFFFYYYEDYCNEITL